MADVMATNSSLGRIPMRSELRQDQTLSSFVSGLAVRHGFRSAARFCFGMGIDSDGVRRGDPSALAQLAEVTGVSAEELHRAGTWRQGTGFVHYGQHVASSDLRRQAHICPTCADEDRLAHNDLGPHASVRGRPWWAHAMVRTCVRHDVRLVAVPEFEGNKLFKDEIAAQLRQVKNQGTVLEVVDQSHDLLDRYVTERFMGINGSDLPNEKLDDVLFLARFLGHPRQENRAIRIPSKSDMARQATAEGLAVVLSGEEAIENCLRKIARTVNPRGDHEVGLRRVYGHLFDRLDRDDCLMPIRKMLVAIGTDQHLISFDEPACLGLAVPPRTLQTQESARRRFGISERELRASAVQLGLVSEEKRDAPAAQVLIDVSKSAELLSQLKDCLNLNEAAEVLGLLPQQLVRLCNEWVITPFFVRKSEDGKPLRYFRRQDLVEFLAPLARAAIQSDDENLLDIWSAGLKSCRQPTDIIAALIKGRILQVFRSGPVQTFRDIRLRVEDVRAGMHKGGDEDFSVADECCSVLNINLTAMRKIIRLGLIKAAYVKNPVNQRPQMAVRTQDLKQFAEAYASINALRLEWGCTASAVQMALVRMEISPAFPVGKTGVGIYLRTDLNQLRLAKGVKKRRPGAPGI